MRKQFTAQVIALTLVASFSLTGCSWWHKHFGPKPAPGQTSGAKPGPLGSGPGTDLAISERPELTGTMDRSQFAAQAVYFEYDSAKIKASEQSKIAAVAAALKGTTKKLIVEGHTDERGTAEYNRSLGEKRAQSAREALVALGVATDRLTTVSFGKDHPLEPLHAESAWSKNRRAEFIAVGQ
ncbi:MAG: OmpA family protein [Verrucomicrobiota bacterium]